MGWHTCIHQKQTLAPFVAQSQSAVRHLAPTSSAICSVLIPPHWQNGMNSACNSAWTGRKMLRIVLGAMQRETGSGSPVLKMRTTWQSVVCAISYFVAVAERCITQGQIAPPWMTVWRHLRPVRRVLTQMRQQLAQN